MLVATYTTWIVIASVLTSVAAAHTALTLTSRVTETSGRLAHAWQVGGAIAMGCGIWSMHFIGMLAYHLPIPLQYDPTITGISLLAAIASSWLALAIANRSELRLPRLLSAGVVMGVGTCTMHYLGMAAIPVRPAITYDPILVAVSGTISIAASVAALRLAAWARARRVRLAMAARLGAAAIMGFGISGMHYTGMAAARFGAGSVCGAGIRFDQGWTAVALSIITFLLLSLTLLTALADGYVARQYQEQLAALREDLEEARAQQQSEHELLKAVMDCAPTWVFWKGLDRRILGHNKQYAKGIQQLRKRRLDNPPPEAVLEGSLIGKTVFELGVPVSIAAASNERDERVLQSGIEEHAVSVIAPDGTNRTLHLLASRIPLRTSTGELRGLVGVVTDVTPLVEAHEAVERVQRRWDMALAGSGDGVWDWDRAQPTLYLSPRWKEMLGYTDATLVSTLPHCQNLVHPLDVRRFKSSLRRYLLGRTSELNVELRMRHQDGDYRWILVRGRISDRDSRGRTLRMVGTTSDITELKRQENDAGNARRLEAIGQLAAGVAHEINTPAQFVGDNLRFLNESFATLASVLTQVRELAREDSPLGPQAKGALLGNDDLEFALQECPTAIRQAMEGLDRISKIVRGLKELSYPGVDRVPTDLNRAIESTVTVASNEWKYVADLDAQLDPTLPAIPVTPGEFQQVVLNLVVNAAHAIEERLGPSPLAKGRITITSAHADGWFEMRVTDTGCGIPYEIQSRIFDAYFTTKPPGKGTGQGLAIVQNIVAKHGGTIHLDSEPGRGTTFSVRLPLADAAEHGAAA